jgi:hypothetical protein
MVLAFGSPAQVAAAAAHERYFVEARAMGFTPEQAEDQLRRVRDYAVTVPAPVDVYGKARDLLAEFGRVVDVGEAIGRRELPWVDADGAAHQAVFRWDPETGATVLASIDGRPAPPVVVSVDWPRDAAPSAEDLMTRALELRRNRHTGPKPKWRAPRHLDPRRGHR